jgi:ABC-2 type transport system ATP-binding protein
MQRPVHTLEINQVALTYGNQKVLDDISFSLQSGRILALIGPNGAGKSSTMRVLAGLVKPEAGFVRLNDDNLTFSDLRKYFGYFIESPSFYNYLTARENLDMLIRLTGSDQRIDDLIEKSRFDTCRQEKVQPVQQGHETAPGHCSNAYRSSKIHDS